MFVLISDHAQNQISHCGTVTIYHNIFYITIQGNKHPKGVNYQKRLIWLIQNF